MGYRDRTLRFDFADLVDEASECWMEIRNPKLCAREDLVFAAGQSPVDEARRVMGRLVVDWRMWDRDTDEPLPVPSADGVDGAHIVGRLPAIVYIKLDQAVAAGFPS